SESAQARYDSIVRKTYTIEADEDEFKLKNADKNIHYKRGAGVDVVKINESHESITSFPNVFNGDLFGLRIGEILLYDDGILPIKFIAPNVLESLLGKG